MGRGWGGLLTVEEILVSGGSGEYKTRVLKGVSNTGPLGDKGILRYLDPKSCSLALFFWVNFTDLL